MNTDFSRTNVDEGDTQNTHRGVFILVVAVLGLLAVTLVFPFPLDGRIWAAIFDLTHCPAFCFMLLFLVGAIDLQALGLRGIRHRLIAMTLPLCAMTALILFALGGIAEFSQRYTGRSSSWHDLASNGLGILAAFFWLTGVALQRRRLFFCFAATVIIAASVVPCLHLAAAIRQQRSFPLLSSFESPYDLNSWMTYSSQIHTTDLWQSHGKSSLEIVLSDAQYSGAWLDWFEADWTGYQHLEFTVQNPSLTETMLTVKVADLFHKQHGYPTDQRYERTFSVLANSEQTIQIPIADIQHAPVGRTMNLTEMRTLEFYTTKQMAGDRLRLDYLRLTR